MYFTPKELYENFTNVYLTDELNHLTFEKLDLNNHVYSVKSKEISRKYDGLNFIQHGDLFEHIIRPFEKVQPLSYDYLSKGKFFYAIEKKTIPVIPDITQFGIIVNNRVFYIKYDPYSYADGDETLSRINIPVEIMQSWLYRSESWNMAESTVMNIYKSNLPSLLVMPLHSIIEGFEDKDGYALPQYKEFLEAKFNHLFKQNYLNDEFIDREKYFQLRCLLDTRPNDDWSKSGYQLFISSHNKERNVYVVPRADVMGIKKLANPVEAIDRYAVHLFSRAEGEFDFMQYAEDF